MKKKILFIINPISGGRSKKKFPKIVQDNLDHEQFDFRISFTEKEEHAFMLAKAAVKENFDVVVAVGGDGTVNEVAKGILQSNTILSIVPFGSGNGLARTLKIPMNTAKSIHVINNYFVDKIDSATFNNHFFFNMAGTGFDAHISSIFAEDKTRGLFGYVKAIIRELAGYKEENYQIEIDELKIEKSAFVISIANSSQYGNEAHIAPRANVKDGILDVVIVKPFPWYAIPLFGIRMFTKTIDKLSFVEYYQGKNISISRSKEGPIHIDGEPKNEQKNLVIKINPLSLKIIVPKNE